MRALSATVASTQGLLPARWLLLKSGLGLPVPTYRMPVVVSITCGIQTSPPPWWPALGTQL